MVWNIELLQIKHIKEGHTSRHYNEVKFNSIFIKIPKIYIEGDHSRK